MPRSIDDLPDNTYGHIEREIRIRLAHAFFDSTLLSLDSFPDRRDITTHDKFSNERIRWLYKYYPRIIILPEDGDTHYHFRKNKWKVFPRTIRDWTRLLALKNELVDYTKVLPQISWTVNNTSYRFQKRIETATALSWMLLFTPQKHKYSALPDFTNTKVREIYLPPGMNGDMYQRFFDQLPVR